MTNFSIKYNSEAEHYEFSKNGKELTAKGSKFANIQNKPWDFIMEKQRSFNWDGLVEEVIKQCNDREIDLTFQGNQNDFKALENAVNRYQGSAVFHLRFEAVQKSSQNQFESNSDSSDYYASFLKPLRRLFNIENEFQKTADAFE